MGRSVSVAFFFWILFRLHKYEAVSLLVWNTGPTLLLGQLGLMPPSGKRAQNFEKLVEKKYLSFKMKTLKNSSKYCYPKKLSASLVLSLHWFHF